MDLNYFNLLSNLLMREKRTNDLLFSIRYLDDNASSEALKHNQNLYKLVKLFSTSGFVIPIDEPEYLTFTFQNFIEICLDDLEYYNKHIHNTPDIKEILSELINTKIYLLRVLNTNNQMRIRNFTLEELKNYNGINGKPSYVAVDGVVYNVTNTPSWKDGVHFELTAGQDITSEFLSCHGTKNILSALPVVGNLI